MRNLTNITRKATIFAAASGLAGGCAALVAVPAEASTVCNLEVVSLTSYDLNDHDGQDEIKFELGGDKYGVFTFPDDWTRNESLGHPDKDFIGSVTVGLFEQDLGRGTIDVDSVSCNTLGRRTLSLDGNGAIYRMVVDITER